MSQHNATVALVSSFGVTLEDVEEFLDIGLVNSIFIASNNDIVIASDVLSN